MRHKRSKVGNPPPIFTLQNWRPDPVPGCPRGPGAARRGFCVNRRTAGDAREASSLLSRSPRQRAILPRMNAPAAKRLTVPEFLAWAETQEGGGYELVRGQVIAMAPERAEHVQAKRRAANALEAAIQRASLACETFVDGLAVAVDEETSYVPDALVNCGEEIGRDSLIAPNPIIVVEVLSPSTRGLDKTAKLADYFRVTSLSHYVIVDLTRRHVVHYRRQSDGSVTVVVVNGGEVRFDPPGISVSVSSFFA